MPVITDRIAARRYRQRLEAYCSNYVLDLNYGFCCAHETECRCSVESQGNSFAAGQLSYVGDGYAVKMDGIPTRILVIPMQVGENAVFGMDERREQVRRRIAAPRNPHMHGVTKLLQVLMGLDPDGGVEKIDDDKHVLEAYAMVNSVLCSNLPTSGRSRRGHPTRIMLRNCKSHLRQTIVLLEPTIIVTQGKAPGKALAMIAERNVYPSNRGAPSDMVTPVTVGGVRAIWCSLYHPAAWGYPGYFREHAMPALRWARKLARFSA